MAACGCRAPKTPNYILGSYVPVPQAGPAVTDAECPRPHLIVGWAGSGTLLSAVKAFTDVNQTLAGGLALQHDVQSTVQPPACKA